MINGEEDRMVAYNGGLACRDAIRDANLITIPGKEHYTAQDVNPYLVDLIWDMSGAAFVSCVASP